MLACSVEVVMWWMTYGEETSGSRDRDGWVLRSDGACGHCGGEDDGRAGYSSLGHCSVDAGLSGNGKDGGIRRGSSYDYC